MKTALRVASCREPTPLDLAVSHATARPIIARLSLRNLSLPSGFTALHQPTRFYFLSRYRFDHRYLDAESGHVLAGALADLIGDQTNIVNVLQFPRRSSWVYSPESLPIACPSDPCWS